MSNSLSPVYCLILFGLYLQTKERKEVEQDQEYSSLFSWLFDAASKIVQYVIPASWTKNKALIATVNFIAEITSSMTNEEERRIE